MATLYNSKFPPSSKYSRGSEPLPSSPAFARHHGGLSAAAINFADSPPDSASSHSLNRPFVLIDSRSSAAPGTNTRELPVVDIAEARRATQGRMDEDDALRPCLRLLVIACVLRSDVPAPAADRSAIESSAVRAAMPEDMPGSEFQADRRLVAVGETVTFRLRGATSEDRFQIFPRYLERCDPERARKSAAALQWLDDLDGETLPASQVSI